MRYRFLRPALAELEEAADYYGRELLEEVDRTIARILDFPEAWQAISPRARRCLTRRFPYGLIYQILDDEILIVAVMHQRRRPMYWKDRIQ